jgi:hypothetical protein
MRALITVIRGTKGLHVRPRCIGTAWSLPFGAILLLLWVYIIISLAQRGVYINLSYELVRGTSEHFQSYKLFLCVPSSLYLIHFCLVLSIHALPLGTLKDTNTDTKQEVNLQLVNFKLRLSKQNKKKSHHVQPQLQWPQ